MGSHQDKVKLFTPHTSEMFIRTCLSLALACSSQAAPQFNGDSSLARILQEQRFNMGDGKFGAAYAQEDGVAFKEESSGNNERIGQYSYIDENGNTIVVKYSAGVNGFRILDGAHIPSGGQTSAQAQITKESGEPKEYEYEYYDDTPQESPFRQPPRSQPSEPHAEGWRLGWSAGSARVHHHPTSPSRPVHHPGSNEILPQGPDQVGQIPHWVQLPVPVLKCYGLFIHSVAVTIFINIYVPHQ